jgi:predicted  nucleic acid-binding Zn-ribbon protein
MARTGVLVPLITGSPLNQEACEKLFNCSATASNLDNLPSDIKERLDRESARFKKATISKSLETNNQHFNEGRERLEKWAEDMVLAAEKELKDTKEQIKSLTRQARLAPTMDEQHQIQKKITELEKKKRKQRQKIFEIEDEIMEKRDTLIDKLEQRMQQQMSVKDLFTIRWRVV